MNFRLKIRFFQMFLLLAVVLVWASVAQADPSHHHHGKAVAKASVVSPFDQLDNWKPLHCILNMHEHFQNIPCPHKDGSGKSDQTEFRSDCGSHPGSANSSTSSFTKNLFKNATYNGFLPLQFSSAIKLSYSDKSQNHSRSIDHPPQFA